jgi:hypothetical protein
MKEDAMSIVTIACRFGGVSVAAVLLLGSGLAWSDSAHFITATGVINPDGSYTARWKEAGLANCPPSGECTYDLTATATFIWQCFNNGNNMPQGGPQQVGPLPFFTTGSFPPSHNGNITASLTLTPDVDGAHCQGGGLKLCLVQASYSTPVVLTDTTLSDTVDLPGGSVDIAPPSKTSKGTCVE